MIKNYVEIPGFSNYLISKDGSIYSLHVNREIKSHINSTGRANIKLISDEGTTKNLLIHRLLAFVFLELPSIDSELEVDHINADHTDYSLSNLQVLSKDEHLAKTLEDRGYNFRPTCTVCGKTINKDNISKLCLPCTNDSKNTIKAEDIEFWVTKFSWTRAAKELGLSDNGLRKRYKKLTGKDPKSLSSARGCITFSK